MFHFLTMIFTLSISLRGMLTSAVTTTQVLSAAGAPNDQIYPKYISSVRTNVLTSDECNLVGNIHVKCINITVESIIQLTDFPQICP